MSKFSSLMTCLLMSLLFTVAAFASSPIKEIYTDLRNRDKRVEIVTNDQGNLGKNISIILTKRDYRYTRPTYVTYWADFSEDRTYRGCGRHSVNHFSQWFGITPSMNTLRNKIRGSEIHSPFHDTNPIFTTPAQMSVDLQKFIRIYGVAGYNSSEIRTIRHYQGNQNTILEQIEHHLRRGTPVVTLVKQGDHWVTVIGMSYTLLKGKKTNITFDYLNNDSSGYSTYSSLKLRNWDWDDSFAWWLTDLMGYTSVREGTLVSLKTDKYLDNKQWTPGWEGEVFSLKQNPNNQYLLIHKFSTGYVHIHKMDSTGKVKEQIAKYDWSSNWSTMKVFSVGNKDYLFMIKETNGAMNIHKMNSNGTVGDRVVKAKWSSGWINAHFNYIGGKTYLTLNKQSGHTHVQEMNSNGTVGSSYLLDKDTFIRGAVGFSVESIGNSLFFYGVAPSNGFYHSSSLNVVTKTYSQKDARAWSKNWTRLATAKTRSGNRCALIHKSDPRRRNGLVHVHQIKSNGILDKMVDTNYFTNRYSPHVGEDVTFVYDPSLKTILTDFSTANGWSTMKYFKANDGNLRLLLLDRYSGAMRILKMDDDCGFSGRMTKIQ